MVKVFYIDNMNKKIDNFLVKTLDGEQLDLMLEYEGKPLLVLFFNIQCLGCVGRAIPLAYDFLQEFEGLNVVAIHSNFGPVEVTKEEILNIFTDQQLPYPIHFDYGKENYEKFECEGTPHWLLIDKEGQIIRSFFGSQENAQTRLVYALEELIETS